LLPPTYSQVEDTIGDDDDEEDGLDSPIKKKVRTA